MCSYFNFFIQLNILLEYILNYVSSDDDDGVESLWSRTPDLVSRLVSAIVEVCGYLAEHGADYYDADEGILVNNLKLVAIKIIGNLGVPDLYSVHPDALPYRCGEPKVIFLLL